ncbi:MAG: ABC transporter substrate-binding protein [Coraliomargarita sp.]
MKHLRTLLAAFLVFSTSAFAADEDPAIKLEKTINTALDVFYGPDAGALTAAEQRDQIANLLGESYDLSVIMRRAMGRNWRKLSAPQQEEVLGLFDDLVVKVTYDNLSGGGDKPEISYGKTVFESDKRVRIPSTIKAEGQTYYISYSLGKLASGWQIYDIVAEEISFVANYRQQFDDHFRRSDGDALIAKLKELLNNNDKHAEIKL